MNLAPEGAFERASSVRDIVEELRGSSTPCSGCSDPEEHRAFRASALYAYETGETGVLVIEGSIYGHGGWAACITSPDLEDYDEKWAFVPSLDGEGPVLIWDLLILGVPDIGTSGVGEEEEQRLLLGKE